MLLTTDNAGTAPGRCRLPLARQRPRWSPGLCGSGQGLVEHGRRRSDVPPMAAGPGRAVGAQGGSTPYSVARRTLACACSGTATVGDGGRALRAACSGASAVPLLNGYGTVRPGTALPQQPPPPRMQRGLWFTDTNMRNDSAATLTRCGYHAAAEEEGVEGVGVGAHNTQYQAARWAGGDLYER
jgi:hypothetical protein